MSQLEKLKALVPEASQVSDTVLQFYLDDASDVICDIRCSDVVETKYINTQLKIAIELFNKRGVEGQLSHSENGIDRGYEKSDISPSLLANITPFAKTPFSETRVVNV